MVASGDEGDGPSIWWPTAALSWTAYCAKRSRFRCRRRLAQKGARESLVYADNVAFVVSVTNRTVITAMDGKSENNNIITNIDSAAIL